MLLTYSLLLFLLSTSATAAPVHEEVSLTAGAGSEVFKYTLAKAAGKLHGAIYVRDDLPYLTVSRFDNFINYPHSMPSLSPKTESNYFCTYRAGTYSYFNPLSEHHLTGFNRACGAK